MYVRTRVPHACLLDNLEKECTPTAKWGAQPNYTKTTTTTHQRQETAKERATKTTTHNPYAHRAQSSRLPSQSRGGEGEGEKTGTFGGGRRARERVRGPGWPHKQIRTLASLRSLSSPFPSRTLPSASRRGLLLLMHAWLAVR